MEIETPNLVTPLRIHKYTTFGYKIPLRGVVVKFMGTYN